MCSKLLFFLFVLGGNIFSVASAANNSEVVFEAKIKTCLSKEVIWTQLSAAMLDSNMSWMWPNKASNVTGGGLKEESQIFVTYKLPFNTTTFDYFLENVDVLSSFEYVASENHAFVGGAKVSLENVKRRLRRRPAPGLRSNYTLLTWSGKYIINQSFQRSLFKNYTEKFFKELRANIEAAESEGC